MTSKKQHNAKYELLPNVIRPSHTPLQKLICCSIVTAILIGLLVLAGFLYWDFQHYEREQHNSWKHYNQIKTEKFEVNFKKILDSNYSVDVHYDSQILQIKDNRKWSAKRIFSEDSYKLVCYVIINKDATFDQTLVNLEADLCTHINIGFFLIQNSTVQITSFHDKILKIITSLKLKNPNLKLLISVGGALADGFPQMVLNHANRKKFIKSVVSIIKEYELNGVDLDWEFPNWDNPLNDDRQRQHFTQLLEEIRAEINRHTEPHKFLLSVAIAAIPSIIETAYDIHYLNQYVDYVNIMCYDYMMFSKLTPFTGFNAPLYKSANDRGIFQIFNINYTTSFYISKGLARSKMVIGLPTYGHSYKLVYSGNNGIHAPASGFGDIGTIGFITHAEACQFIKQCKVIFDLDTRSPYAYSGNNWISYENVHSLTSKTEFIKDNNFGGVMLFNLNTDNFNGTDCESSFEGENSTNLFQLHRTVKNVLFDDAL